MKPHLVLLSSELTPPPSLSAKWLPQFPSSLSSLCVAGRGFCGGYCEGGANFDESDIIVSCCMITYLPHFRRHKEKMLGHGLTELQWRNFLTFTVRQGTV
jgi:hypothetical protein